MQEAQIILSFSLTLIAPPETPLIKWYCLTGSNFVTLPLSNKLVILHSLQLK